MHNFKPNPKKIKLIPINNPINYISTILTSGSSNGKKN